MKKTALKCIIDGNRKKIFVSNKKFAGRNFRFVKCPTCGLIYVNISDSSLKKILDRYYDGSYEEEYHSKKVFLNDFRQKISRKFNLFYCESDSRMKFLEKNGVTKKNDITDLGCGAGTFIIWLEKKGYTVYGVEPDASRIVMANKYLTKRKVTKGFVNDIKKRTDVICMIHVLEHLVRPDITLRYLKRKYPNSKLFIEVPNCKVKEYLKESLGEPHNYHFTTTNLKKLLENTGWNVLDMQTTKRGESDWQAVKWLITGKDCRPPLKNGWAIRVLVE